MALCLENPEEHKGLIIFCMYLKILHLSKYKIIILIVYDKIKHSENCKKSFIITLKQKQWINWTNLWKTEKQKLWFIKYF